MTWHTLAVGPWHKDRGAWPVRIVMRASGLDIAVHEQIDDGKDSHFQGAYFPCNPEGIREALEEFERRK